MYKPLKDYTDKELIRELDRRAKLHGSLKDRTIKAEAKREKITLAVNYIKAGYGGPPQYILGILKNKEFRDFYYSAEIEDFQRFIPDGFHECMESTYKYTNDLQEGLDVLKKVGYTHFTEIYE
jgi:hypothetical protein